MKQLFFALFLGLAQLVSAQNMMVYNVTGTAEKQENGAWTKLTRRAALQPTDIVRVGENSALSVLDRGTSKVYAIKQSDAKKLSDLISAVQNNQSSANAQYFDHMVSSLFNGGTATVSHNAAGCSYRGATVENDIARTLAFKKGNNALSGISNGTSDYGVKFELIDRKNGNVLDQVYIGKEAYFRITNTSDMDLYVNILDINAEGELYDCLPVDEAMTLSHLMIPANSTVDLADHAIAFSAPAGTDHLILIAMPQPFDLREVNRMLLKPGLTGAASCQVGLYNKVVKIDY